MLFRTHFVFAVFVYLIFFELLEISFYDKFVFGLFLLFATLFVDIDSKKSRFGSHLFFRPLQLFFSHRGMIHSFFIAIILSGAIYFFSASAGAGFFVGYFCHLLLDFFTKQGVSLLWPLYNKKFSLIRLGSGGLIEEVIFVLLLLCDIFIVVFLFFNIEI